MKGNGIMVVNGIFFVNYMLYEFINIVTFVTCTYLLTPKSSRVKTVLILTLTALPLSIIKFCIPLFSNQDVGVAFLNNAIIIVVLYIVCIENIFTCAFVYFGVIIVSVLGIFVWEITPYATAQNWELGTTIGYIISAPVIFIEFAVLIWGKRFINNKNLKLNSLKMSMLIVMISAYYILFVYMMERGVAIMKFDYSKIAMTFEVVGSVLFIILLFLIFKKGEEQQQLERYKELEHQHAEAKHHYEMLLKRTEKMEKVRHDFYGQLTTARYIISQDKEKGMQMLAELKERLESINNA